MLIENTINNEEIVHVEIQFPRSGIIILGDFNQLKTSRLQLNEGKCKELRIGFNRIAPQFDPILINNNPIEVIESPKILSLYVSSNLKWNDHIHEIIKKAQKRLLFLSQLKKSNIGTTELVQFYTVCIQPILEYASPIFHDSLTAYLSNDLEMIQKRALRMIFPWVPYDEALSVSGLQQLSARRQRFTDKLFHEI